MEMKSFEQLTSRDERVGRFGPLGFSTSWVLRPEASLRFVQEIIADYDLSPAVPDTVREYFELSRKLHTYGYFAYELFTEASFRAYFAVELALKVRFLEAYQSRPPLVDRATGTVVAPEVSNYAHFVDAIDRTGPYPYLGPKAKKGWFLQGYPSFNGSLNSLMEWVVHAGVLRGRRIEGTLEAIRYLRNFAAHPTGTTVIMPPDSAGAIKSASNIINRLWGLEPDDAVVAAGPPKIHLFGLWRSPDGSSRMVYPIEDLQQAPPDRRAGYWILLEAADQDAHNLLCWSPDYELTLYPTAVVWEGDSWEGAVAAWGVFRVAGHLPAIPRWENRLFLVRYASEGYEPRRSPEQFRHLAPSERDLPGMRWKIMCSDHPTEEDYGYIQAWGIPNLDGLWMSSEPPPGDVIGDFATWGDADQRLRDVEEAH